MSVKSISTSENITIKTDNNSYYMIEIQTFLGTTIFKDTILPKNKIIEIKGLCSGKYIICVSNESKLFKKQIKIK